MLIPVEPDVLCHIRKMTNLVLLRGFAERLVAHLVELDVLGSVLESCGGRWVQ